MFVKRRSVLTAAGGVLVGACWIALGCRHQGQPSNHAIAQTLTTHPVTAATTVPRSGGTFSKSGISLAYPVGWIAVPDKDYELLLKPVAPISAEGNPVITLDVPELPFHLPGMIPMGLVKKGYLDDLKTQVGPTLRTREESTVVAESKAVLVSSTWQKDGKELSDVALIIVHSDHVYILRVATDAAGQSVNRGVFEEIAKSVRWVK